MTPANRDILNRAVEKGLLPPEKADQLIQEAESKGNALEELLRNTGLLSEETLRELCRASDAVSGDSETLALLEQTPPGKAVEVLPMPFGRYVLEALVGQGGMGRVYRAYDRKLRRVVALKILSRDAPDLVQRFAREARSQAKIDHENVCRIYEVDEWEGTPYIAMQFLDGTPLNRAHSLLSFEQKVDVMRQVAEGVQAAHSVGLVHRDLKPGNLMVTQDPNGGFRAHILDFGLARSPGDNQVTVDGALLGTPAFMAPEHLDTSLGELDRRTDVYALGATFYQLVTRELPFASENTGELFRKILEEEPAHPRTLAPSLPRDIAVIILTCLQKKPHHRYSSAKALHDDLQRFQRGEPIQARPMGVSYLLRKKIRKHPTAALGILSILAFAIWFLFSAWHTARREQQAANFTALAKDLETEIRLVYLSPKHDIRPDLARLAHQLEQVETRLQSSSSLAKGPGWHALGKGFLALGDYRQAQAFLEKSWSAGYRTPAAAFTLSQTYLGLYRQELWKAQLIADEPSRQRRMTEIHTQFKEPALRYLEQSKEAAPSSATYLNASLAFFEGEYLKALDLLENGPAPFPWEHEHHLLQGDIFKALALECHNRGEKDQALAAIASAMARFRKAQTIAESNPQVYRSLGEGSFTRALLTFFDAGDLETVFREGLATLEEGLSIQPNNTETLLAKARLGNLWAEHRVTRQLDPLELASQAISDVQEANAHGQAAAAGFDILARAHWIQARWQHEKGADPRTEIAQSLEAMVQVPVELRDHRYFNTLGSTHLLQARYEESRGLPSAQALEHAVEAYHQAIGLAPQNADGYINLGICQFKWATQHGIATPTAIQLLNQTLESLSRAKDLQGGSVLVFYYLGRANLALAQQLPPGPDRQEPYRASREHFLSGLALNPDLANLHSCMGELAHLQAVDAWTVGTDPSSFFAESFQAYGESIRATPSYSYAYHNLGLAFLDQARLAAPDPKSRQAHLASAQSWLEQSQVMRPNRESLAALAEVYVQQALVPSQNPAAKLTKLEKAAELAAQLKADHATYSRTWYVSGLVDLAKTGHSPRADADSVAKVLEAFAKAGNLEPGPPLAWMIGAQLVALAQKPKDAGAQQQIWQAAESLLEPLAEEHPDLTNLLRACLTSQLPHLDAHLHEKYGHLLPSLLEAHPHLGYFYFLSVQDLAQGVASN